MGGVKSSLTNYAVGLGGGVVYAISTAFLGSGLLGGLLGAGLAGAVVKGDAGRTIATILGFQSIVGALSGSQSKTGSANESVL